MIFDGALNEIKVPDKVLIAWIHDEFNILYVYIVLAKMWGRS